MKSVYIDFIFKAKKNSDFTVYLVLSDTTDRGKNIHKDTLCTCQLCSYLITVSLASVLSYNNQVCCLNVSISFHDTWKIRSITIHCTIDSRENYFEINVSALKHSAENLIGVDLRTYCLKMVVNLCIYLFVWFGFHSLCYPFCQHGSSFV